MSSHFDKKPGEPDRDRWGRYMLPDPVTGEKRAWTRVTTVANLLSDTYNLELWKQRMVALGLASRPDLLALVKTTKDKRKLNRIVGDAFEAGNVEQRANIGTAIHAATELMDRGEDWDIQAPYDRDVEAYAEKMDELEIYVVDGWVERIVLNPELEVAGTLDRLVINEAWARPRVADIKTGATVHFSVLDHAIQQAMYANATHVWDPELEELVPMPDVDKRSALILHVPAGEGKCEVHDLDIEQGLAGARVALEIRRMRKAAEKMSVKYNPEPFGGR